MKRPAGLAYGKTVGIDKRRKNRDLR